MHAVNLCLTVVTVWWHAAITPLAKTSFSRGRTVSHSYQQHTGPYRGRPCKVQTCQRALMLLGRIRHLGSTRELQKVQIFEASVPYGFYCFRVVYSISKIGFYTHSHHEIFLMTKLQSTKYTQLFPLQLS